MEEGDKCRCFHATVLISIEMSLELDSCKIQYNFCGTALQAPVVDYCGIYRLACNFGAFTTGLYIRAC